MEMAHGFGREFLRSPWLQAYYGCDHHRLSFHKKEEPRKLRPTFLHFPEKFVKKWFCEIFCKIGGKINVEKCIVEWISSVTPHPASIWSTLLVSFFTELLCLEKIAQLIWLMDPIFLQIFDTAFINKNNHKQKLKLFFIAIFFEFSKLLGLNNSE